MFLLSFYKLFLFVRRITLSASIVLNKTRPGSKLDYWLSTQINCSLSPCLWSGFLPTAVCKTALICPKLLLHSTQVNPVPVAWSGFETRSSFIRQRRRSSENNARTPSTACVCKKQTQGSSFLRAALYECCCITVPRYTLLCSVHFSVCISFFTYSPSYSRQDMAVWHFSFSNTVKTTF